MESAINVIWIDPKVDSNQNQKYKAQLESEGNFKIRCFFDPCESMAHLKSIKYEETFIIVSGRQYTDLIGNLIKNFSDLYIIPKIIVFTSDKNLKNIENINEELYNGKFYKFGGIYVNFSSIKKFIVNSTKNFVTTINENKNDNMDYDLINNKEQLLLPLLFKSLIGSPSNDEVKHLNEELDNNYGQKSKEIQILFNSIKNMNNIPLELLSKYYSKIYYDDNLKLEENSEEYLTYVKVLYEGIKLKSLPLTSNNVLYSGSLLTQEFIETIKESVINKKKDLPAAVLFSKSFLNFSKDEFTANNILNINKKDNLNHVLFILENANNIDYIFSTHTDFENNVLFLPFSAFEIKDIKNTGNKYEIRISYLDKYMDNLINDENIVDDDIPNSKFKEAIDKFGLINSKIFNIKDLLEKYDKYKLAFKENYLNYQKIQEKSNKKYGNKNNFIIGEINVDEDDKEIRIINSCNYNNKNNKEEIEKAIITIDDKKLDKFSYFHKFNKKGKYNIKYDFQLNNLEKTCNMFSECEALTSVDLSNLNSDSICDMSSMFWGCKSLKTINFYEFKAQNVTDMSYLFSGCKSLEKVYLSELNLDKVANMSNMFFGCGLLRNIELSNIKNTVNLTDISSMFSGCKSLTNINLSELITAKVTDMSYMFLGCKSLTHINLSKFNTENVTDMSWMFSGCESLIEINLPNFKSKNINDISSMFGGCQKLININLSNLNTKEDTNMCCIFNGCKALSKVNLSNFDTINDINLFSMFSGSKPSIECNNKPAKEAMTKEL